MKEREAKKANRISALAKLGLAEELE